ncbi:MAG: STAS domain-containing protein [Clostridiales bacterium]|nr:STAS domain-containing protein [Clostridiales bacterium]
MSKRNCYMMPGKVDSNTAEQVREGIFALLGDPGGGGSGGAGAGAGSAAGAGAGDASGGGGAGAAGAGSSGSGAAGAEAGGDGAGMAASADILLDFANTAYISSAGLRVLLMTEKKTRALGGSLEICNVKQQIQEIFELTGLAGVVKIT